jgi:hypothetical protein
MKKDGTLDDYVERLLSLLESSLPTTGEFITEVISELEIFWDEFTPKVQRLLLLGIWRHRSLLEPQVIFTLSSIVGEKTDAEVAFELTKKISEDLSTSIELTIHCFEHLLERKDLGSESAQVVKQNLENLYKFKGKPVWG